MGYSIFDETMVEMTWPEIEKAASQKAIVILPVGIIEEHGPHMALAVDTYAACLVACLARRELENRGIASLIAPPQYWGVSAGTSVFPGTFSVRPETMQALVYDILASLYGWGLNKVFVINWHGDLQHVKAIIEAVKEARHDTGMDALGVVGEFDTRRLRLTGSEDYILVQQSPPLASGSEKYVDLHAGSLETGVMLEYFPEHVRTALAKKLPPTELTFDDLKELGKSDEVTRKLIPAGYFGNPSGYDTEAAEKYIKVYAQSLTECIERYLKRK